LLDDVDELVDQELVAIRVSWCVTAGREDNVVAQCVGAGLQRFGRARGICVGMNAHVTEIVAKQSLGRPPDRRLKWLTRAPRHSW
jgi:hypothetical protein